MRHILTLVDGGVVRFAVALLGAAAMAAALVRRRRGPAWRLFIALAGSGLIVALTVANRGVVVSDQGLGYDLTWWTRNWGTLPALVSGDPGWWFNVALFVPAAIGWTLLTGRPVTVSSALAGVVLVIETLHATVLSGAGDPTDVVANLLGIAAGVGVALAWLGRSVATATSPAELGA